jgi:hypothetical protein
MKNPIQDAIDAAVKDKLKTLVTKDEFDALADRVEKSATPKELDQHVGRILEKTLPDLINAALLQLLAVPKKDSGGGALNGPCPRQPHKGKCPSAWCVSAEKKAAAESDE